MILLCWVLFIIMKNVHILYAMQEDTENERSSICACVTAFDVQCVCRRSLTTPIKYTCVWNGRGLHAGDWVARSLSSLHCHMVGAERWLLAFSVLALTAPHCWTLHGLVSTVKKKILFSHFLNLSFAPPWPLLQDVSHYRAPLVTSQLTHRVPCRAVFDEPSRDGGEWSVFT